jgi:putative transposase
MVAHRYIDLMSEMGVVLSHSRPRVSNDNAFSEAQFKTQKYQPDYPDRFDSAAHARAWCTNYVEWYTFEHHHAGLADYSPEQVFTGRYLEVAQAKQLALDARFAKHPERFVAGRPKLERPPAHVTINPVTPEQLADGASSQVSFPTLPRATVARDKYSLTLKCLSKTG